MDLYNDDLVMLDGEAEETPDPAGGDGSEAAPADGNDANPNPPATGDDANPTTPAAGSEEPDAECDAKCKAKKIGKAAANGIAEGLDAAADAAAKAKEAIQKGLKGDNGAIWAAGIVGGLCVVGCGLYYCCKKDEGVMSEGREGGKQTKESLL